MENTSGNEAVMMRRITDGADHIILACGVTDFRKQITGLTALVTRQFKLDPFKGKLGDPLQRVERELDNIRNEMVAISF